MLIRKRIVTSEPEREVVVVRPRTPYGLYALLAVTTLAAVGAITYFGVIQPQQTASNYETAVIVDQRPARAQRLSEPIRTAPNIIVTPPPVIQTLPVEPPGPAKVPPREAPVYVEGYSGPDGANDQTNLGQPAPKTKGYQPVEEQPKTDLNPDGGNN